MLDKLDEWLYQFLLNHVQDMPLRFAKMIACYYADARVRKAYLERLGVCMGEGTFANPGLCVVANGNEICAMIGDHVSIAPNVMLICQESANNGQEINSLPYVRDKLTRSGNIIVEDEVWIGANVTILSGVRIGRCAVIGAGSVVIKDVEAYSVYAGVPAVKIRSLKSGCELP